MHCITCNNKIHPLCPNCTKNPYFVEKARRTLAQKNEIKSLRELYSRNYTGIRDNNSNSFWNLKFTNPVSYAEESIVTRERIKIAASYIPENARKILDIGVGTGLIEEYFADQGLQFELHGLDISQESIRTLKKKFKGDFRVGSAYSLPYKKNSFDVALALEVLEHISPQKTFDVLRKIKVVLKPGGYFIASVPLNEKLWGHIANESSHLREYSPDLLEKELAISGLRVVNKKTIYAFENHYFIKNIIAKYVLTNRRSVNDLIICAKKI